jgi:Zn finger protein HypA/HybF involved in hydrogenase expression
VALTTPHPLTLNLLTNGYFSVGIVSLQNKAFWWSLKAEKIECDLLDFDIMYSSRWSQVIRSDFIFLRNFVNLIEPWSEYRIKQAAIENELCKIWCFHGGDYEEWRLLEYKTPVCTSQETHYVSTTESSQLMLCKIWCFHGGDYEEWRLLEYKTPVCTSQETHYLSATQSSRLMLCKIWCFHGGYYEEFRLLGCMIYSETSVLQKPRGVTSLKMAFFKTS